MVTPATDRNPLIRDREVAFLLHEVFDVERLCRLEAFAEHSRDTFDAILASSRRLARDHLYLAYALMDAEPPQLRDGPVNVHPRMQELYGRLVDLGLLTASRSEAVGGQALPRAVTSLAVRPAVAVDLRKDRRLRVLCINEYATVVRQSPA